MLLTALVIGLIIAAFATMLVWRTSSAPSGDPVARQIDALLPQTQCEQCSYPGCKPYAQAIARGDADINLCPPGGQQTVDALARLLNRPTKPLAVPPPGPAPVALIDEDLCIGCVLCIKACPVDAIIGAAKRMHTVIASDCTGCELCLPPCPVDCISLVSATQGVPS